jgi:WD40 repeat protein
MGRRESPLDADAGPIQRFAYELRMLRQEAGGITYRDMAERAGYAVTTLSQAAAGERLASLPVVLTYVRACGGDVTEWERRWRQVAGEALLRPVDEDDGDAPYLGLARYEQRHSDRFFGRERLVEELLELARKHRFSAVFGPSGSGKSSLLRAGLVPAVRQGRLREPLSVVRVLTPGERPVRTHAGRLSPADSALVVVDQFEEIFTLCRDRAERTGFIDLLLQTGAPGSRMRVVVAVRADFYGRCAEHRRLTEALREANLLVGPMDGEELREAIVKPAMAQRLIVERALTGQIIDEVLQEPGGLPLMSHALLETWRRRRGRMLTLEGYQAAGGVHGAIAATAEQVYAALSPAQAREARRILLRLVDPGDRAQDTRRPAGRAELDPHDSPDTALVLDHLARARLLTLDQDTVEVAHEALIASWPRLRRWIEEERELLQVQRRLTEAATTWQELGRDPGALYRGARLAAAARLLARPQDLTPLEHDFLTASAHAAEQAGKAASRRRRLARVVVASLVVLAVTASVAAVAANVFQRQATAQRNHAIARLVAAEAGSVRSGQPGLAKQLYMVAYRMDPQANAASLFAALETPGVFDGLDRVIDLAQSRDGETLALSTGSAFVLWSTEGHEKGRIDFRGAGAVALSPDGRILAGTTAESVRAAEVVHLWDVGDPSRPRELVLPEGRRLGVASLAFSPDGRLLALGRDSGAIDLWDVTHPSMVRPLSTLTGHGGRVRSLAFAPSGHVLAGSGADGTVRLWNLAEPARVSPWSTADGGQVEDDLAREPSHQVAFSPDGRVLAGPGDGTASGVRWWNIEDLAHPRLAAADDLRRETANCGGRLVSTAFSPHGSEMATVCGDDLQLWQTADAPRSHVIVRVNDLKSPGHGPAVFARQEQRLLHATDRGVRDWDVTNPYRVGALASLGSAPAGFSVTTSFSPGPRRLLVAQGSSGGTLWDFSGSSPLGKVADLPGSGNPAVSGAAFSPDGEILATSESDTRGRFVIRLRSTRQPRSAPLATIGDLDIAARALAYSPDGRTLAVADGRDDGPEPVPESVKLYDVTDVAHPRRLVTLRGEVFHLAFSPNGRLLAANGADTLLLWDVSDPGHPAAQASRQLTAGSTVSQSAFRPDGRLLAVTDTMDTTRLWRVDTDRLAGEPVTVRTVGSGGGIAFSPDGRTLAWSSLGDVSAFPANVPGHIELWDVSDPRVPLFQAAFAYNDGITKPDLSYNPHGAPILATTSDTVDLWATQPQVTPQRLCASIGDVITPQQWSRYVPDTPYQPPCG